MEINKPSYQARLTQLSLPTPMASRFFPLRVRRCCCKTGWSRLISFSEGGGEPSTHPFHPFFTLYCNPLLAWRGQRCRLIARLRADNLVVGRCTWSLGQGTRRNGWDRWIRCRTGGKISRMWRGCWRRRNRQRPLNGRNMNSWPCTPKWRSSCRRSRYRLR